MQFRGTVFRYGRDVDTDVIIPARYLNTSDPAELAAHCLEDLDATFRQRVKPGDIIAFRRGGSVVTHRVVQVRVVEGDFVTKGDANQTEDMTTVTFSELVGRVERHIPRMGDLAAFLTTVIGKVYLFALLLCGVLFHILARRVREA